MVYGMEKIKVLIAVVAFTVFFLLVEFVRNVFQLPENKVKYNVLLTVTYSVLFVHRSVHTIKNIKLKTYIL